MTHMDWQELWLKLKAESQWIAQNAPEREFLRRFIDEEAAHARYEGWRLMLPWNQT